jgi:hypothetical protein
MRKLSTTNTNWIGLVLCFQNPGTIWLWKYPSFGDDGRRRKRRENQMDQKVDEKKNEMEVTTITLSLGCSNLCQHQSMGEETGCLYYEAPSFHCEC